jgi:hypothetical protein
VVEVVAPLIGELVHLQELREAQDRVERGAQLVAHARQVLAFCLVGLLGDQRGLPQRLLDLSAAGDVAHRRRHQRALIGDQRAQLDAGLQQQTPSLLCRQRRGRG